MGPRYFFCNFKTERYDSNQGIWMGSLKLSNTVKPPHLDEVYPVERQESNSPSTGVVVSFPVLFISALARWWFMINCWEFCSPLHRAQNIAGRLTSRFLARLYTGWWYTYPSEKYYFVSWDDYFHYMEK